MEPSIFTRIIRGEIPCHKVYEDDQLLAFLDIHPVQPGHILVVPKQQIEQFTELNEEVFTHLMQVVQKLAQHLQAQTGCWRVNLRIEGYDVAHTHIHLIPTNHEHESYNPHRMEIEPDHTALAVMAKKLAYKESTWARG